MRIPRPAVLLFTLVALAGLPPRAAAAGTAVQEAVAALQRQDYRSAERILREDLKLHPNDAETLSLLGVALDEQKKSPEAREFHQRAIASAPRSTAALYNYANNLLASGDEKTARETLLRSLAIDPADRNANLALAQLALNRKDGKEALIYLERLKNMPETAIMRLTALDLAGNLVEAGALFDQLSTTSQNDGKLSAAYGWALAQASQFAQAETFFTHALAANPSDFQILYGLGVAASQAGHNERARGVLETALRLQPESVDTLYALAIVYAALSQPEPAIRVLAEAGRLDPKRADVQKLLAITARNIKADEDSVAAWGRYLKLVPGDDEAKRELAFGKARLALLDEALPDLQAFVAKYPKDPVGFYELGMAESVNEPEKAIESLDRAIGLKPDFVAARGGRGILLYTQNKAEAAISDLEYAVNHIPADSPESAAMLDRLGQAYLAVDRLKDAIPALRKAAAMAPDEPTTQLHLANALAEAGQTEESDALMAHFRQMRPGGREKKVSGVVDYLGMAPKERHDLYQARLEKTVHDHPDDVNTHILYLKFLLSENQMPQADAAATRLVSMKPGAAALTEAGHALLAAKQYSSAKQLLEQAAQADSSLLTTTSLRLDLAIAAFHATGAATAAANEGLRQLELIPASGRDASYHLARAQMLDAAGKSPEAIAAMESALATTPDDPDLYWEAVAMMTRNHRAADALPVLDRAAKALPQEAQIPVIRATVLESTGRTDEAQKLLTETQHRWPEVASSWVAQGMMLAAHNQMEPARKALETAVALGAHSSETLAALARLEKSAGSGGTDSVNAEPEKLFLSRPPRDW